MKFTAGAVMGLRRWQIWSFLGLELSGLLWAGAASTREGLSWSQYRKELLAQQRQEVQLHEIASWQKLGQRWAVGLDDQKRPLAIVELSFTEVKGAGPATIILHQSRSMSKRKTAEQHPPFLRSESALRWETLLQDQQGKIPWIAAPDLAVGVKQQRPGAAGNSLAAIDLAQLVGGKKQQKFFQLWQQLIWWVSQGEGDWMAQVKGTSSLSLAQFLQQFRWQASTTKGPEYLFYFRPHFTPTDRTSSAPPQKLVDFRAPRSVYFHSVAWELAAELLGEILQLISVAAPVSALLEATIGSYLRLQGHQLRARQNMLSAFLWEMNDQNIHFPLEQLRFNDVTTALTALFFVDGTSDSLISMAFTNPQTAWRDKKLQAWKKADRSLHRSNILGPHYELLSPYFAWNQRNHQLYLLGAGRKAQLALASGKRQWIWYWETILRASCYFLPFPWSSAQLLLLGIYHQFWARPALIAQYWEYRLLVILEQMAVSTGREDWRQMAVDASRILRFEKNEKN